MPAFTVSNREYQNAINPTGSSLALRQNLGLPGMGVMAPNTAITEVQRYFHDVDPKIRIASVAAHVDNNASLQPAEKVYLKEAFVDDGLESRILLNEAELNFLEENNLDLDQNQFTEDASKEFDNFLATYEPGEMGSTGHTLDDAKLATMGLGWEQGVYKDGKTVKPGQYTGVGLTPAEQALVRSIQQKLDLAVDTGHQLDFSSPGELNAVKASQMGDYIGEIGSGDYTDYQNLASQGLVAPIDDNLVRTDVGERQNFLAGYLTRNDLWGEGKNAQGENRIGINASDYYGGNLPTDSSNPAIAAAAELLGNDSRLWSYNTKSKAWDFVGGTPGQNQKVSLKDYNPDFKYGWTPERPEKGSGWNYENPWAKYRRFDDSLPEANSPYDPPSLFSNIAKGVNKVAGTLTDPLRILGNVGDTVLDKTGDLVSWIPFLGPRVDSALDSAGNTLRGFGNRVDNFSGNLGNTFIENPARFIKGGFQTLTGNTDAGLSNMKKSGQNLFQDLVDVGSIPANLAQGALETFQNLTRGMDISIGGSAGGGGGGGSSKKKKKSTPRRSTIISGGEKDSGKGGWTSDGRYMDSGVDISTKEGQNMYGQQYGHDNLTKALKRMKDAKKPDGDGSGASSEGKDSETSEVKRRHGDLFGEALVGDYAVERGEDSDELTTALADAMVDVSDEIDDPWANVAPEFRL